KLEVSVDKIFDEGASGDGQGAEIQPVAATTDTIVEDVAPLQPRRQRKRKTVVVDAGGPSHPPKNKGVPKDPFPKSSEFNAKHFATLVVLPTPFHKYPEPFLCLVGISRYYTSDEDAYPEFLGDNDEGGCLL
nr:hypothetical protein [Tanacetum cinerariifolium]